MRVKKIDLVANSWYFD